jgi:hypothetical protein
MHLGHRTSLTLAALLLACDPATNAPTDGGRSDGGLAADTAGSDAPALAVDAPILPGEDGGTIVAPPSCDETPLPETTRGAALYFSDCQAGAAAGCVAGDDASPGTSPDAPRRTLGGIDLEGLAAGTQLLFARGGAWDGVHIAMRNPNATPTSPIVVAAYTPAWGGSDRPLLRTGAGTGVELGSYSAEPPPPHGGYHVEGLHFDGGGVSEWGFWIRDGAQHVTVLDCEIEGYQVGLHFGGGESPVRFLSIRGSHVHHNEVQGLLGHADDLLIEGNRIEANNFSGSGFNHGIYLGGHGEHLRIRNNVLARNSVTGGRCTGGNLTIHGHWNDAVLEGNTILQDASDGGCYGFSITPAYNPDSGPEFFTSFVVRGNTVVNLGNCAICAGSAPGIVIESNVVVSDRAEFAAAIQIPGIEPGEGDVLDGGAVIRNNTFYWSGPANTPAIAVARGGGEGLVAVSNLIEFAGGGTGRCFDIAGASQFTTLANNLCHGGAWSSGFPTLAAAQAAGLDVGGLDADPMLAAAPSAANGWLATLGASSPAIDAGHASLSSTSDRTCAARDVADIGAFERTE